MRKGAVAEGKRKDKSFINENRMRTSPRTRVAMDFDPKLSIWDVDSNLIRHQGRLSMMIAVEFYSVETDVKMEPPARGMHFYPLIFALGISLPLTPFVQGVLRYCQVPPTQLAPGAC